MDQATQNPPSKPAKGQRWLDTSGGKFVWNGSTWVPDAAGSIAPTTTTVPKKPKGSKGPKATPNRVVAPTSQGGNTYVTQAAGTVDMTAQAQASAFNTVDNYLAEWGLSNMSAWAWDKISSQGDHVSAAGVINDLRTTKEYQDVYPGNAILAYFGKPIIPEATYKAITQAYQGFGQQYGLPAGFLSPMEMGTLIAQNVSTAEFESRLKNGYSAAMNADPEVRTLLHDYYGADLGNLAAYYLDPKKGLDALTKQTQAAMIGNEAYQTGFKGTGTGQELAANVAGELSAQMTTSGYNMDYFKTGFTKAAGLQPLEQTMAGQRGQATVSSNQILANSFTGLDKTLGTTPTDTAAALKLAEQARTAGLSGGGGYVQDAGGGVGVGRTSTAGTGK
jgi:hypothetical protein